MHVVVTGGAGFIGSHLVDRLVVDGQSVTILDDLSNGELKNVAAHLTNRDVKLKESDFLDEEVLAEVLPGSDVVVHLAAIVNVLRSVADPVSSRRINTEGTIRLLEQCVKHGVKRFVFASSAAVYGSTPPPLKEEFPPRPLSPYAASKAAGEAYCNSYFNSYGLETVILRFMNVYGPRRSGGPYSGVMTKFAEALYSGKPIIIYGDGNQTRDFVHVEDVVSSVVAAISNIAAIGETLNIGSGVPTSINSLAKLFISVSGKEVPIEYGRPRKAEVRASFADISKAKAMLNYSPSISLSDGVKGYLEWYLENWQQTRVKE